MKYLWKALLVVICAGVIFSLHSGLYAQKTGESGECKGHAACCTHQHKTVYVCPMKEDDYTSDKPGKCPKCGMNLVETKTCEVMCPLCKTPMAKDAPKISVEYKGQTYYFCCEKCKAEFEKNPGKIEACCAHGHKAVYFCPMKECDYKSDKAGHCPKCGMVLKEKKEKIECPTGKDK